MRNSFKFIHIRPYIEIIFVLLLTVVFIVGYGTYRCSTKDFVDPITKSLLNKPFDTYTDGWAFLHFACYGLLAYFYPARNQLLFIGGIGIAWEIIETIFKDHPFYFKKCKYQLTTDKATGWWYGRYEDIIMNSLGMIVGYYFATK
jgi:hypothetical protein